MVHVEHVDAGQPRGGGQAVHVLVEEVGDVLTTVNGGLEAIGSTRRDDPVQVEGLATGEGVLLGFVDFESLEDLHVGHDLRIVWMVGRYAEHAARAKSIGTVSPHFKPLQVIRLEIVDTDDLPDPATVTHALPNAGWINRVVGQQFSRHSVLSYPFATSATTQAASPLDPLVTRPAAEASHTDFGGT